MTDGAEVVVVSARRLRAARPYMVKRVAEIRSAQARKQKGSRRWKQLEAHKNRVLAQQKRRTRAGAQSGSSSG